MIFFPVLALGGTVVVTSLGGGGGGATTGMTVINAMTGAPAIVSGISGALTGVSVDAAAAAAAVGDAVDVDAGRVWRRRARSRRHQHPVQQVQDGSTRAAGEAVQRHHRHHGLTRAATHLRLGRETSVARIHILLRIQLEGSC